MENKPTEFIRERFFSAIGSADSFISEAIDDGNRILVNPNIASSNGERGKAELVISEMEKKLEVLKGQIKKMK